jgi:hypothetical protein
MSKREGNSIGTRSYLQSETACPDVLNIFPPKKEAWSHEFPQQKSIARTIVRGELLQGPVRTR